MAMKDAAKALVVKAAKKITAAERAKEAAKKAAAVAKAAKEAAKKAKAAEAAKKVAQEAAKKTRAAKAAAKKAGVKTPGKKASFWDHSQMPNTAKAKAAKAKYADEVKKAEERYKRDVSKADRLKKRGDADFAFKNPAKGKGLGGFVKRHPVGTMLGADAAIFGGPALLGAGASVVDDWGPHADQKAEEAVERQRKMQYVQRMAQQKAREYVQLFEANTVSLAQSDPQLFNELMAGRRLPSGAVVFGGRPKSNYLESVVQGMTDGNFSGFKVSQGRGF